MRRLLAPLCLLAAAVCHAQVPTPGEFLGYPLGSRFVPHERVVAYVEAVAAAEPARVRVERYGETYERRPLLTATVASARNMARLDAIRQANLNLAAGRPAGMDDVPAIVWMSYNVHGNEAVSSNAVLDVLHRLLTDPEAQRWLENTVVILDPCINPDGYNRYTSWYNAMVGGFPNADPLAREHREPWPGGRPNHYYFDLNRDWAWGTQVETRQRIAAYRRWMPHLHADYHEQGVDAPYYFAPAAEPFHAAITPWQRELQNRIGAHNAATFDATGRLYFTREVFDLFYPAYGDTWPTFNGAVGMTYEQGGSGRAGLAIETAAGDTLTLAYRIAGHVATSLGNVAVASRERDRIVQAFGDYFAAAVRGEGAEHRAYAVRATNGADRLAALTRLLDHNGITYGYARARTNGEGYRYADGTRGRVTVEAGDLVVPVRQPAGHLARVLFEPDPVLSDSLTYDVTAWALPFAHGLDAAAVNADVPLGGMAPSAPAAAPTGAAYAYAFAWGSAAGPRVLGRLFAAGVRVRTLGTAARLGGQDLAAGALVVARADNARLGAGFDAAVSAAAREAGATAIPLRTGFAETGSDLGAGSVAPLRAPRVLVVSGEGVSTTGLGEVWHYFDEEVGFPVTLVNGSDVTAAALARFDVVVMPAGSYGRIFNDERVGMLRTWVEGGGTLVALESAVGFLAGKEGFSLKRREGDDARRDTLAVYGERERRGIAGSVPGAIYRVTLDPTHPLAFGYGDHTFSILRSDAAYPYLTEGWNVGTLRDDARVAGFTGNVARRRLQDVLIYGVQEKGQGAVVYLVDGPLFRRFWRATELIFANAVFRF
jgi:hypothetical protein